MVLYKSTRGQVRGLSYEQVLLATYAPDGGLFVPECLPMLSFDQLLEWKDFTMAEICAEIIHLFTEIPLDDLCGMTRAAFSKFNEGNEPSLPLQAYGSLLLLDTSLGPTLSFKDIGQQVTIFHSSSPFESCI